MTLKLIFILGFLISLLGLLFSPYLYSNQIIFYASFLACSVLLYFTYKILSKWKTQSKGKAILKYLLALYLVGLYTGIFIGPIFGNGSSPGDGIPIFIVNKKPQRQQDYINLLKGKLQWYDHLFLLSFINVSDGIDYRWVVDYRKNSPEASKEAIENAENKLNEIGICLIDNQMSAPEVSLPTRSYFGLYYKNFLVTCNKSDFNTYQGFGRFFPRD